MAGICANAGNNANVPLLEFYCDTKAELNDLPTMTSAGKNDFAVYRYAPMGSSCVVGNGTGSLEVYILFSDGWKKA